MTNLNLIKEIKKLQHLQNQNYSAIIDGNSQSKLAYSDINNNEF